MTIRLQLGTSRLEKLPRQVLPIFLDKTWIHLGDLPEPNSSSWNKILKKFRQLGKEIRTNNRQVGFSLTKIYTLANFLTYFYKKDYYLPFKDTVIDYIFSEHFVEHLFLDEAFYLLEECHRVLKPHGVIRTCVPDADLRIYEAIEPAGYPKRSMPFTHPEKHKSRWSVYSLSEVLRRTGFKPIPLRYCDKRGSYHRIDPEALSNVYDYSPDKEMIYDMRLISRTNSLIVDGIKMNE